LGYGGPAFINHKTMNSAIMAVTKSA